MIMSEYIAELDSNLLKINKITWSTHGLLIPSLDDKSFEEIEAGTKEEETLAVSTAALKKVQDILGRL